MSDHAYHFRRKQFPSSRNSRNNSDFLLKLMIQKNVKMMKNEESKCTLSWELLRSITSQGIGSLSVRIRTSPT